MAWFKDKFEAEPVECPRGWGQVTFNPSVTLVPVVFAIEAVCPIGGVGNCTNCHHSINPASAELLRTRLEELDTLRGSTLSEEEFRIRRRMIVQAQEPYDTRAGQGAATGALVMGPLGVVLAGTGWYLTATVHLGFLGMLGGGLAVSALALGLAGISRVRRRALLRPDPPPFEELPGDNSDLEARLERAEEELGFFRELHRPDALGQPQAPEASEPEAGSSR